MASVTHARKPVPAPQRGRAGARPKKPATLTTLAFDPGKHTGFSLLTHPPRKSRGALSLVAAGAILLRGDYQDLATALDALLEQHAPDRVIVEGWENQGKRLTSSPP